MNKAYREQKPLNFLHFSNLNNEKFKKFSKKGLCISGKDSILYR